MNPTFNDIPFIDVYVRLDQPDQALYRSMEKGKGQISQLVPPQYKEAIERFAAAVKAELGTANDGAIDFEGARCRLSMQRMSDHSSWVCARRINTVIPDFDKLGIQPGLAEHMKQLGTRDGLILISGATGAGKTTTAVGLLAYYLKHFGGTAVTLEDPVEYTLKGRHGDSGQCFQVEIKGDEDWALALKRALRWAPRYIYVGEIRTPKAAEQLLRAAATGHLVITTVHAGSPEEALMAITFLAEQAMGPGVEDILSAALTAVVYQSMKQGRPWIRYVFTEPDSPGDSVRSLVREKKIGMLSTYIDRIASRLSQGNATMFGSPDTGAKPPAPSIGPPPGGSRLPPAMPPPVNPVKK